MTGDIVWSGVGYRGPVRVLWRGAFTDPLLKSKVVANDQESRKISGGRVFYDVYFERCNTIEDFTAVTRQI